METDFKLNSDQSKYLRNNGTTSITKNVSAPPANWNICKKKAKIPSSIYTKKQGRKNCSDYIIEPTKIIWKPLLNYMVMFKHKTSTVSHYLWRQKN